MNNVLTMKAKEGDYTLVYSGQGNAHRMSKEDHDLLQALVMILKKKVVIKTVKCKYEGLRNL